MNIFLSFASEQKNDAELIAVALRDRGHTVFFSKDTLPAAKTFDLQIEKAVAAADVVIFLLSPQSVARGKYTLTELTFVKQKWKNPSGHVLPVMAVNTPMETVPSYLRAVGILEPEGNVVAETASHVDKLVVKGSHRQLALFAIAGPVSGVLTYFAGRIPLRFSIIPNPDFGKAPIMCGIVFGILVAGCNWTFGLREKLGLIALVVFTTLAWVLAWDSTLYTLDQLKDFTKEIVTAAEEQKNFQYLPFRGAISGFIGGLVGGAVTVFGISVVNRRFRRIQDLLPVIVAATVLGGLVEVITATITLKGPFDWAFLPLFVCWQTAVIVLVAKALAANPTDSVA